MELHHITIIGVVIAAGVAAALYFLVLRKPKQSTRGNPTPEEFVRVLEPKTAPRAGSAEWVRIDPGTFTMGSPPYEGGYNDATQHQVTITGPNWLQATAVTQAEWEALMGVNPSKRWARSRLGSERS